MNRNPFFNDPLSDKELFDLFMESHNSEEECWNLVEEAKACFADQQFILMQEQTILFFGQAKQINHAA